MIHLFRSSPWVLLILFVLNIDNLYAKPQILTIGDSLTFGLGVAPEKTWPSLLEAKLKAEGYPGVRVVNAGSSGATTAFGLSSLKFQLKRTKPDLVIYALGANDGLRGLAPASTQENLMKAMELLQKEGVPVLLLGMKAPPNYGEKFPKDFEKSFQAVQAQFKLAFIPFLLEGVAGEAAMNQGDGIHPNEKGYEKILQLIYPQVKKLLERGVK